MSWDMLPMEELIDLCHQRNVDPSGKRADLIARLEAFESKSAAEREATTEPTEEPSEETTEPES